MISFFKAWSEVVEEKLTSDVTTATEDDEDLVSSEESGFSSDDEVEDSEEEEGKEDDLVDLEDLGKVMHKQKQKPEKSSGEPKVSARWININ